MINLISEQLFKEHNLNDVSGVVSVNLGDGRGRQKKMNFTSNGTLNVSDSNNGMAVLLIKATGKTITFGTGFIDTPVQPSGSIYNPYIIISTSGT